MRTRHLLALAAVLSLALPATAPAATKNGITPLAPKAGATVTLGESPTFRMRARGPGQVWVYVCDSARKLRFGVICNESSIGRARRVSGVFRYKPRFFDFPEFWLNTPGTYYWQAHRIQCTGQNSDCSQEGPVVRFKVG
jgi:hypothetical protein